MIVIAGGGYAGAATALALARRGCARDIVLLEAEPVAARHASGRNAGLLTILLETDPVMAAVAARGARLQRDRPGTTRCGSILLVPGEREARVLVERAAALEVDAEVVPIAALARQIPPLAGAPSPLGVRCPEDATIDPGFLAGWYLDEARRAGVRVVMGARVTEVVRDGRRVTGVETSAGPFETGWLVNAAGAWAGPLGRMAGLTDLGLIPYRRHIFISPPLPEADPSWPFVWDLARQVYFRTDRDRLMLCMCDEDRHASTPPEVDTGARGWLAERLPGSFPALVGLPIETERACLRTFAPDRRYVIGPDPRLAGFFWVAGLGGSGVIAGAAIGEMAADLLALAKRAQGAAVPEETRDFDPGRLIGREG